jgi:hypothetical protein
MRALIAAEFFTYPFGFGFAPAPLDVADDAFEGLGGLVSADAVFIGKGDFFVAGAVQDSVLDFGRQLLEGRRHRDFVVRADGAQRLLVIGGGVPGLGPRPDGALFQRQRAVGHHQIGLELHLDAEAVALRAGASRRVE